MAGRWRHLAWIFQEKFSSFPGSTLLDSSFSSSLSQGPSHLCFDCFWQVVAAPLKFSSKRISSLLCFVFLGKVLAAPLDLWSLGGLLFIWRMREGSCHMWSGDQRLLDVDMAPPGLGVWCPLAWSWEKM